MLKVKGLSGGCVALCFFVLLSSSSLVFAQKSDSSIISLQLRWDHQFQFAGYYAADWLGFYEEEGLTVDIRSAIADKTILSSVSEVSESRADMGVGAADILVGLDEGRDLIILASYFQKSAAACYALRDTRLEAMSDLTRLKFARIEGDLIDIEFQAALREEGIDPSQVPYVALRTGYELLLDGSADVVAGYSISFPFVFAKHGIEVRSLRPSQFGINFYGDSLFTTGTFLKKNRTRVEGFVRATSRGWAYALDHPDEIAARIVSEFPQASYLVDPLAYNLFQARAVSDLMDYPIVAPGHTNNDRWQKIADQMKAIGVLANNLDSDNFVYDPERDREQLHSLTIRILRALATATLFLFFVSTFWIFLLRRKYKKSSDALHRSLEELNKVQETASMGSWTWNTKNGKLIWSEQMYRLFGVPKETFTGDIADVIYQRIHPDDRAKVEASNNSVVALGKPIPTEYRIVLPDNTIRTVWAEAAIAETAKDGSVVQLSGYVLDISERKKRENELERLISERETLIREIYHRTRNNMNVILSLLELQTLYEEQMSLSEIIKAVGNRITAMALVHEQLYEANDLSRINLKYYIAELIDRLQIVEGKARKSVSIQMQMDDIFVVIDTAIPFGLVVSEIISNALAYAFPDGREGVIQLKLEQREDSQIELVIKDDGIGLPAGFDPKSQGKLGMTCIFMLTEEQLFGSVEIATVPGVEYRIRFKSSFYGIRV